MATQWTGGYATGATYTAAAYEEISPSHMRYAMISAGRLPPALDGGAFTYCELGFGYGLSLAINAACSPEGQFWGTDFMSEQVMGAKHMQSSDNLRLFDQGFDEFCTRDDLPQFDFIAMHGIWSWITPQLQQVLLTFLEKRLNPGGVVYVSYNTLPGWHTKQTLHHLLKLHYDFVGHGLPLIDASNHALAFATDTLNVGSNFFTRQPMIKEGLDHLYTLPRRYVSHEHFNQCNIPLYFHEAQEAFSSARLQFAATAALTHGIDAMNLNQAAQEQLAKIPNLTFRETMRDMHIGTGFRKDLWARGAPQLDPVEHVRLYKTVRFQLVHSMDTAPRKITAALGESVINEELLSAVVKHMQAHNNSATAQDLIDLKPMAEVGFANAKQMLDILVAQNIIRPRFNDINPQAIEAAKRLNAKVMHKATTTEEWNFLASPLAACSAILPRLSQLFLKAYLENGTKKADALTEFACKHLAAMGHGVLQEGKPVTEPKQMREVVLEDAKKFLDKQMPALIRLGIM